MQNNQQRTDENAEEILKEYRRSAKRSIVFFAIAAGLVAMVIYVVSVSLVSKNKDVSSLLLSTAVSLFVSLLFAIFYSVVVDQAQSRADSKAQSLEIMDVKNEVSREIQQSTQNISVELERRISRMLEEEATRLVDHWPQLLPKDYFPPSEDSNPRFLEKLGEAVEGAQHYMFRGATGRFVPNLLQKHGKTDLSCSILLIDPRATTAIQIYAINRHGARSGQRSLKEFEADIQQEIYMAIVNLFDLRRRFRIEVHTCNDHLFHRSEIVDDGAFVSFYVGDRKTLHPPAHFYTRGTFYYSAFRQDFQLGWEFSREQFAMRANTNDDALEEFLVRLGAGDNTTITQKISDWRAKSGGSA